MKKTLTFFLFMLAAITMQAQVQAPQPSPHAKIWQTVGLTEVTVEYSRPSMRGRDIFGDLVPFDKKWRTGANENTTISFSDDVTIDGETLTKGTYAIYSVPGKNSWEIMFYKKTDNWGLPQAWDNAQVALSTKAQVTKMPMTMETFTIVIDELKNAFDTHPFVGEVRGDGMLASLEFLENKDKLKFFDPAKEFIPQKLDKINLIKARKSPPVYWIYENNKIKRVYFYPLERKVKTLI